MIEPESGVFVGTPSAIVRQELWKKAQREGTKGGGAIIYSNNNEQGFSVEEFGSTKRRVVDVDGLSLVHVPSTKSSIHW